MTQTAQAPPGVVAMITGEQLLTSLNTLAERMGKVETNTSGIPAAIAALEARQTRADERIAVLENGRAFLAGIGSVVTLFLTGGIVAALITALHH